MPPPYMYYYDDVLALSQLNNGAIIVSHVIRSSHTSWLLAAGTGAGDVSSFRDLSLSGPEPWLIHLRWLDPDNGRPRMVERRPSVTDGFTRSLVQLAIKPPHLSTSGSDLGRARSADRRRIRPAPLLTRIRGPFLYTTFLPPTWTTFFYDGYDGIGTGNAQYTSEGYPGNLTLCLLLRATLWDRSLLGIGSVRGVKRAEVGIWPRPRGGVLASWTRKGHMYGYLSLFFSSI
jgi:hypothetical protein